MSKARYGIFTALIRLIWTWNWQAARGITDAANASWTKSPERIEMAYDIAKDEMVEKYDALKRATARLVGALKSLKDKLEELNAREEELLAKRQGALVKAETAKKEKGVDSPEYKQHSAAFERFHKEIMDVEAEQAAIDKEIEQTDSDVKNQLQELTNFEAKIHGMEKEKAMAVAKFVTNSMLLEVRAELNGLRTSIDMGPVEAVRKKNAELSAQVFVDKTLDKTDVLKQDEQYLDAGKVSVAGDVLSQMLAAREAERQSKTGENTRTATDRPDLLSK